MAAYVGCIAGAIGSTTTGTGCSRLGSSTSRLWIAVRTSMLTPKSRTRLAAVRLRWMQATRFPHRSRLPAALQHRVRASVHEDLTALLSQYDVNAAAASVKVYAVKPAAANAAVTQPAALSAAQRSKEQMTMKRATTCCFFAPAIPPDRSWRRRS